MHVLSSGLDKITTWVGLTLTFLSQIQKGIQQQKKKEKKTLSHYRPLEMINTCMTYDLDLFRRDLDLFRCDYSLSPSNADDVYPS
jgi:hypothetical protein